MDFGAEGEVPLLAGEGSLVAVLAGHESALAPAVEREDSEGHPRAAEGRRDGYVRRLLGIAGYFDACMNAHESID